MQNDADRRIQEIVAKTIIARGRRQIEQECVLKASERPEKLLGVTCVPGAIRAARKQGQVTVAGNFEIHIWYAHSDSQQTTVLKQTFTYDDIVPVTQLVGEPVGEPAVQVILSQSPQVTSCHIAPDGRFHVNVALEVQAELTGEARLRVQVFVPPTAAVYDEDFDADNEFESDDDFATDGSFLADGDFLPNGNVTDVEHSTLAEFD